MLISSTWWLVILSPSQPKEETPESQNNFSFMAPRYVIYMYHMTTDRTLIRSEEGPKGLAAPPTANMAQVIFSLPVAVDTLGGYNWRHHGDF